MIKQYRGGIVTFYLCAAAALIAAVFVDLKLDIILNNPHNPLAMWFCNTGEMPCRLVGTVAGVMIFYLAEKPAIKVFGFIVDLGASAYLGYHIARYFFLNEHMIIFGILYGLGVGVIALWLGKYLTALIPEELKKPLLILSFTGIAVMFVELGVIEVVKIFWGRVRFRDLLKAGSYDAFTAWYLPNGKNGNRSFPSGHTGGAAMSYLMLYLPLVSEKWKKHKWLCFVFPFVYTSVVAFTRLVMGAHYLSDVTVGGIVGFTAVLAGLAVAERLINKNNLSSCPNDN